MLLSKFRLHWAVVKALVVASALVSPASGAWATNPLFEGADPDIAFVDGKYWVFCTNSGRIVDDTLYSYSSTNLDLWKKHGPVLAMKDIHWIKDDRAKLHSLWAPGVFYDKGKGGRYYIYYSVGPQNPTPSRIGVASSRSPSGLFVDSGKPLITGDDAFEAIDAMVFRDPESQRVYLYCGGSAASRLHVYELNDDLISIKQEVSVPNPAEFTEGAFMHFHNGLYYLSYSHGHWDKDDYCVAYSTAPSPLGPWTYKGKILVSDSIHAGPGHHAFFENPKNHKCYVVYHRWNGANRLGHMPPTRSVCIEPLRYDSDGAILPIRMTE
ncbi:MAG: family 43 glycosylhydrolase [Cyanobacteria bacterium REEB67]|nr:family 43 glycosylhydrolase [Cyanobacteria bacterium REEB67]